MTLSDFNKTVYFETFGCPKNIYDSAHAAGILEEAGFSMVDAPEDAAFIIVNTCGFIEDAKRESIDAILELAEYKDAGKFLVVSGCLTQRYGREFTDEMPEIDAAIGVGEYERLPSLLQGLVNADIFISGSDELTNSDGGLYISDELKNSGSVLSINNELKNSGSVLSINSGLKNNGSILSISDELKNNGSVKSACNDLTNKKTNRPLSKRYKQNRSVYIKIADGCDNRCSYCIIPYIRGRYQSRPMEEILSEAEELSENGAAEIILVAQDVTAYGIDLYGEYRLTELVRSLCSIDRIKWIRLMYCYEDRITDELIKLMAEEEKVCNYIDIPLQHVSDRILKAMGRRSTKSGIINTISRLRAAMPDICIRTTFITGFPGETKQEFTELLDFVSEYRFGRLGVFAYSKEEGTPAATFKDQISKNIKENRLDELMRLQQGISLKSNQTMIGSVLKTLVEEVGEDGSFTGRTMYDAPEIDNAVIFSKGLYEGEVRAGDFVQVLITDAFDYDLVGEMTQV